MAKQVQVDAPTRGAMFKAGLKGAFSAASIASMIPDVILAIADRVAAKEALQNIQVKFIKAGFARGVAAGIMRWTEAELDANSKNRMTSFRLQGMGDAAGMLKMGDMFKLAEAVENYAVDIGYAYAGTRDPAWKNELRDNGLAYLRNARYHFGDDPERCSRRTASLRRSKLPLRPELVVDGADKFASACREASGGRDGACWRYRPVAS